MKVTKSMILPLASVIFLGYAAITGHKIPDDIQNQVVDAAVIAITLVSTVYGIYKNHHDNKTEEKEETTK